MIGWVLFYQPKSKVIDETKGGGHHTEQNKKDGDGKKENTVVLNQSVYAYLGKEADKINAAISGVDYDGSELILKFDKQTDVELATLEPSELFWLEGDKSTPLTDTYIGKIISKTETDDEILLNVGSPTLDEVFDELYLDEEMQIDAGEINNIRTMEGVTITPVDKVPADFLEVSAENVFQTVAKKTEGEANNKANSFLVEFNVELSDTITGDEESNKKIDKVLKLTGKAGLEDLSVIYKADWDKKKGMEDLYLGVKGNEVVKFDLEMGVDGEFSGDTTEEEIASFLKLQGLDKKMIPIAYFDCTPKKAVTLRPDTKGKIGKKIYEEIEESYQLMPLSCGFMCYIDVNGNMSLKADFNWEYKDQFENKLVAFEDYKPVFKFQGKSEPSYTQRMIFQVRGDADAHVGVSVQAYLFNINMADIAIMKLGAEAEGEGTIKTSTDEEDDSGGNLSFYGRGYLKVIDAKAKLSTQLNLWKVDVNPGSLAWEYTFMDQTLKSIGKKADTHYDANTMKWKKVTAEDEQSSYYKGVNGNLIKESKKGYSRESIFSDEFFSICGVDKSYIYVLQATQDEQYNVRRIHKNGKTSKVILKDVKYVLSMEGEKLFYVPSFSPKEIYAFDRGELTKEKFASFEDNVEFMGKETDTYCVVTQKEDAFSWIFGPECKYYRMAQDGKILQEQDDNLPPEDYFKEIFPQYRTAYKLVANGYLHESASEVDWLAKNSNNAVKAEGCSGWHPTEAGIFTELDNGEGQYEIVLYRAADGGKQKIADVSGMRTFFTLVQDSKHNWYYMDQTDTEFVLYKMDSSFRNKEKIESISREKINVDQETCGMELTDNRIFFYTMPEWSESKVLYRYNLF